MSLVITSNVAIQDRPETSNVFKPYSYQNRLLNTMKIPANSEIAVQSVKINKNGLLIVDRTNSGFGHYFGVPVGTPTTPDINHTTTSPFFANAGSGAFFDSGGRNQRNVEDFAVDIKAGLVASSYHPSLITGATTASVTCTPQYTPESTFKGYNWTATQNTLKTKRATKDIVYTDVSANERGGFTQAAGVVSQTSGFGFYVQNREYPLSQNAASVIMDFDLANLGTARSPFMCGLSRINTFKNFDGVSRAQPEYYNTRLGPGQALEYGGQRVYADICIARVSQFLRVYQVGFNGRAQGGGRGQTHIQEIDYTTGSTEFPTLYDLRTNTKNYEKVKFTLVNEEIKIYLINDVGGEKLLMDFSTRSAQGKGKCTNPISAPKWAMYPVMACAGSQNKSMQIDEISHYSTYPKFDPDVYANYDWWGYLEKTDTTRWAREIELRFWNDSSDTSSGTLGNGLLAPRLLTTTINGGMAGYENLLITGQSQQYGEEITAGCNTQFTFGFIGNVISPVTSGDLVTTIESTSVPKLISNVSLFIRLNNFTQNTINARQGTTSKIVAHLPRFDNSGNETGGLYFEPNQRTYVSLGNTDDILVNSFDIDIVYDDERLCTALSGKTIVCFHVREKGSKD